MEKKERIKLIIAAAINYVVFGLVTACVCTFIGYLLRGSKDNRFIYYTNISNITVGLFSLANSILLTISLIKGKVIIPKNFSIGKFMALGMTSLTFVVVLFVLAPITSFYDMYSNVKFFTHLIVPVISLVSYLLLEEKTIFEWKYTFIGLVPPTIYSIVYSINVVGLKTWPDIYQINSQGIWYVFMIATLIIAFGVCPGLYFAKRAINKSRQ